MHTTSCQTCHWTTARCQSLTAVALLCTVIAVQLAACGSTDANDEAGPSLEVSPSELGYGEIDTEAEVEAVITITNNGDATLEGTIDVDEGSDYFSISSTGRYDVAAESSLEVTVTFEPKDEAELDGTLSITHNAENANSPLSVPLSGTGIVDLADPPGRPTGDSTLGE